MFLLNFFFGMIYGMFTLIFPMTLPVVLLQMLVAWFAMMASSGYCIALILHARRQGAISTRNRSPAGHFPVYLRC